MARLTFPGTQFGQLPLGVPQLGMPQIPQAWDVQGILANQPAYALLRPQVLTIYMQDYRTEGEPDHLLAELNIPLWKDANEQWWVNADDMVRKLQSLPGRIDGRLPWSRRISFISLSILLKVSQNFQSSVVYIDNHFVECLLRALKNATQRPFE